MLLAWNRMWLVDSLFVPTQQPSFFIKSSFALPRNDTENPSAHLHTFRYIFDDNGEVGTSVGLVSTFDHTCLVLILGTFQIFHTSWCWYSILARFSILACSWYWVFARFSIPTWYWYWVCFFKLSHKPSPDILETQDWFLADMRQVYISYWN